MFLVTADCEVETTALMMQVYPRLRERCLQQDYELQLVDTTWGMRDVISDDHSIVSEVDALIDGCRSGNQRNNFFVVRGL